MSSEDEPDYPRPWLKSYLTPLVSDKWRIIDSFTLPETLDRPTVTLLHNKIEPYPAAPQSDNLVNRVVIRVVDNLEDPKRAEDALDDEVLDLVYALKGSDRLRWLEADKVQVAETNYYAWDIAVQVLSTDKSHTPPEPEEV